MSNLLQNGVSWLAGQLKTNAAAPVTYWRGGVDQGVSCPLSVTWGETRSPVIDDSGAELQLRIRDALFDAADLVLDGCPTTPQEGDKIVETDGTVSELLRIEKEGLWRWSDPYKTRLRVHTQKVGSGS